jgi:hypothetical protein
MTKTELSDLTDQAFLRGFILRELETLPTGQTLDLERTPLGGRLEAVHPHNGFGPRLTDNIKAAIVGLEQYVKVIPANESGDGKVHVILTGI